MKTFLFFEIFLNGLSKRLVSNFKTSPILARNTMFMGMPMAAFSIDVILPTSV